ncbi:MBL fold metallo-hydrolase [Ramlibacter rhizophilus]
MPLLDAVDVGPLGGVRLGPDVICDGFRRDCTVRVQTHVHADHLHDFETSKGYQEIITSPGSYDLLVTAKNADLPYRRNFAAVPFGKSIRFGSSTITLLPTNHILGAAQVQVVVDDGRRLGYSGDFQWPMDSVISCDCLVLDSTHGSPRYQRQYRQDQVDSQLQELLLRQLRFGPVALRGHTGLLQRAITLLCGQASVPVFASDRTIKEYRVYEAHGYPPQELSAFPATTRFPGVGLVLLRMHERPPAFIDSNFTRITLSQYISDPREPLLRFSDKDFRVAMSDHAEFAGILEYVSAVAPKLVLTDNSRGGHAVELAREISVRLGIPAVPSTFSLNREWGG